MDASSVPAPTQNVTDPTPITLQNLNPRQLGGLIFLGDIGARLAEAWQPEFAQPLTEAVRHAGGLFERHDLPGLLDDTLSALGALRKSGLLASVRDNAAFIADSWEQLQPLMLQVLQIAQQVPWADLQQDMASVHATIDKLHALVAFYEQNLAAHVTETIVEMGVVWQETRLEAALLDAAQTLGALHRDGTLGRMRDASAMVASIVQNSDLEGLTVGTMQGLEGMTGVASLPAIFKALGDLAQAWQQSAVEVAGPDAAKGGLGGMIKLLRDPAVQQFLQRVIATAQHVEHPAALAEDGTVRH